MGNSLDKKKILEMLVSKIRVDLAKAQEAYESSRSLNQGDDMKQEGKYDTRAIEAGYLAGAQMKRVEELKIELQSIEKFVLQDHPMRETIAVGAIVELELNGRTQLYFISTAAGGTSLLINSVKILVITSSSPLGSELIGRREGDRFEVQTPSELREYLICSVC